MRVHRPFERTGAVKDFFGNDITGLVVRFGDNMKMKRCSNCGEEKPSTSEYFYKCNSKPDGLTYFCRACQKAKSKAYYEANKDKLKAYRVANKDKEQARHKAYREANKDKVRLWSSKRRALKKKATVEKVPSDYFETMWKHQNGRCWWCSGKLKRDDTDMDHIIPLSRGGKHSKKNLCLAHLRCNRSKGTKLPQEYAGRLI